jgi:hypothetical protein
MHDLMLASAQLRKPHCGLGGVGPSIMFLPTNFESAVDRGENFLLGKRFFDEVHRPSPHRPHGQGHVAISSDDDDRQRHALDPETILYLESTDARHSDIDDQTAVLRRGRSRKKVTSRSKTSHSITRRLQQHPKGIANGCVIIRDKYGRLHVASLRLLSLGE